MLVPILEQPLMLMQPPIGSYPTGDAHFRVYGGPDAVRVEVRVHIDNHYLNIHSILYVVWGRMKTLVGTSAYIVRNQNDDETSGCS